MTCPECQGKKTKGGGFAHGAGGNYYGPLPCHLCKGWGEIEPELVERMAIAERVREEQKRLGVTAREHAMRLGIETLAYYRLRSPQAAREDWNPEVAGPVTKTCKGE